MKNPHVRTSLLIMTAFLFILSFESSLSCNTAFDLPLFYSIHNVQELTKECNIMLRLLPEIAAMGDQLRFGHGHRVRRALRDLFYFLKNKRTQSLVDAGIERKRAEDFIKKFNSLMRELEYYVERMIYDLHNYFELKKESNLFAIDICEKTFPLFSVFNDGPLAGSTYHVAFATVYLVVAQVGKAYNNPQYIRMMQPLLDELADYEFMVKPHRKHQIKKISGGVYDAMTDKTYSDNCHWTWHQEMTKRIKKFFTPVKEALAAFLGVPLPVRYQYYTRWGEECFYGCDFHQGTHYSWCWTVSDGLGNGWSSCSKKNNVTIWGRKCLTNHGCGWNGKDHYWCKTDCCNSAHCSPVTIQ